MPEIEVMLGDITTQNVDAIVNPANTVLLSGAGVNGDIHRAAGPLLLEECRALKGCITGEAKITRGYNLQAKYIIHTVGPIWADGNRGENQLLFNCYFNCLRLAVVKGIKTIAFPSIGTSYNDYQLKRATTIAIDAMKAFLMWDANKDKIEKIIFVCSTEEELRAYEKAVLADF